MGSNGRSTISGLGPSRVSIIMFSFANSANLYCTLHFCQRRGSGVGLSQKESTQAMYACLLTAPCRTLLRFSDHLRSALAFFSQKCDSWSAIPICTTFAYLRHEIQREICNWIWIRKLKLWSSSACNHLNKVWSDMSDHKAGNQDRT